MENINDLYMLFLEQGFWFLIPLDRVRRVGEWSGELEEGQEGTLPRCLGMASGRKRYQIVLEQEGQSLEIAAEEIAGIREIDRSRIFTLLKPVLNERNRYLQGVVWLRQETGSLEAAYLLDPAFLYERCHRAVRKQSGQLRDEERF